jgi:hypothetical protein
MTVQSYGQYHIYDLKVRLDLASVINYNRKSDGKIWSVDLI